MEPIIIYDYLLLTRQRVLEATRGLTAEQYRRTFPIGVGSIAATLTHIMISEWYYIERLERREVPAYERWPIKYEAPPEFGAVEAVWRVQGERVRAVVAAERDWGRSVAWDSFADEQGKRYRITTTAGGLFTQLALHEVHHRAQVMAMLRGLGVVLEDLDFNALMFGREGLG